MEIDRLLRLSEVETLVGFKHAKIYAMAKQQRFPAPLKVGVSSRWSLRDLSAWMESIRQPQG